jgi:hypothetical protein
MSTSMPDMGQQAIADSLNPAPDTSNLALSNSAPSLQPSGQPTGQDSGVSPAEQAPQIPTGPQKPSLWRTVLAGALQGLATGASVPTRGMSNGSAFVAGAGAGANEVLNAAPQRQAALDEAKAQTAFHYSQLVHIQREMNLMPDNKREQYLTDAADTYSSMLKSGAAVPMSQPGDLVSAQQQLQQLHAKNPWAVYSLMPVHGDDGTFQYSAVQFTKSPTQADITIKGAGPDGADLTIPAGTQSDKVGMVYSNIVSKKIEGETKSDLQSQKDNAAMARQQVKGAQTAATAQQRTNAAAGTNVVAFDPEYQNPDGSKGANVVLDKGTAQQRGLFNYKADPSVINANVAGLNDVQVKLNQLADVVTDKTRMTQVQPELAAAMLEHGKGIEIGVSGTKIDTSRINEGFYKEDVLKANQATRDFVAAYVGAHEAITQLPRLQTFGKSSRMTETQLHAALNMLPQAGDGDFAPQKMDSLQNTIDPLRKQMPHMPGAELMPTWREKQAKPPAATHVYIPGLGTVTPIQGGR